jgi:predicted metalloprotease with PDZ domain
MRLTALVFCLFLYSTQALTQGKRYQYTVDLSRVENDQLHVELLPPPIRNKVITFHMPRIIPGAYAICDYGRFIHEFKAVDRKGKTLPVEHPDPNTWMIRNANKVTKITYRVDDTFDTPVDGPEIFWPAGTNIEADTNFLLNTSGFFGYFEGLSEMPFTINILRDKTLYGATGLIRGTTDEKAKQKTVSSSQAIDTYHTADYDELIDSPMMYSAPDTAVIRVGTTDVIVGSYSPNKRIKAKEIASTIKEVLHAQKKFLGGRLPVDKYAFIFYFTDEPVISYGALEHSYSSVYYMPEGTLEELTEELQEIAAHEFFHVLTPLTVHSELIANFDYNNPRMSQHLWLYEGVTEYFASLVQVKYGLINPDQFLNIMLEKMHTADQFINDVPFTEISKDIVHKYHDQYYNVYQKGALIALCLDLRLRKLSGGTYGLINLMLDLSKKYGKNKAFSDDQLFEEIAKLTYPEVKEFFYRHVKGIEALPLREALSFAGVYYKPEEKFEDFSLGLTSSDLTVKPHENKPMLHISSTKNLNAMGLALGFEEGDILIAINDEKLPDLGPELGQMLQRHHKALPETSLLSYKVLRKNESGEYKEVKLSAPVTKIQIVKKHLMHFDPNATAEQLGLRDAWLKP